MINLEQANAIRAQYAAHKAWLGDRCGYHPSEVPAGCEAPGNADISALEVFEFCNDPPTQYFLYIDDSAGGKEPPCTVNDSTMWKATTWTGEFLGAVFHGREWRDNFGGKRVPITVRAINGRTYHGAYYKSAGSYARVKLATQKGGK